MTANGHRHLIAIERFLIVDDSNANKILTLSTTRNLAKLFSADIIYGDETLYTSTNPVKYTTVDDVMYPLVLSLLPRKSEQTYGRLFTYSRVYAHKKEYRNINCSTHRQQSKIMQIKNHFVYKLIVLN